MLSTVVVAATDPDAHAWDVNTDPRLSVLLGRLIMTVLLNNHGRLVMTPLLLNNHGLVMTLFPAIAMLVTDHLDA